MSGFALDDRHRSIRRYLMNTLGAPPWRIRTERQPVKDEHRPVAVVEAPTPAQTTRARTSIPQGDVERQQTFTISLYPKIEDTAAESRQTASAAADLLSNALTFGLVWGPGDDGHDDGDSLSPPEMIPVYDFAGVEVKGSGRAGPADHYGWMRADDYPVGMIQDPDDFLRYTITCTLRVSWTQGGRVANPDDPIVGSMPGAGVGSPGGGWPPPASPAPPPLGGGNVRP